VFKQLFRRMMHLDDWNVDEGSLPHDPFKNGLKYLYHYHPNEAFKMMTSKHENWTRAIFVREPLERLLSAYLDKGKRKGGQYVSKHCYHNHTQQPLSFPEFLHIIRSSCRHDSHWMPQTERIDAPFWSSINFLGKFDSLQKDTKTLLENLDAWDAYGASGWGPYHNESIFSEQTHAKHETGSSQYFQQFYNDSSVQKLALDFYHQDYSHPLFHFTPHVPII
jgi:carbohydrate 4-sulfotransferase 9